MDCILASIFERFWWILGSKQVGVKNRAKIDPKRHRKSDEKKKVNLGRLGRVLGRFKGSAVLERSSAWPPGTPQYL